MNTLRFLVGCTASGKKALALELCARAPLRALALDSVKVFQGMDRGSDKWTERPFGLTDLVPPTREFSVGEYCQHARRAVAEAATAGLEPLFVGGTGLYLRALVRGLFDAPPTPEEVRRKVRADLEEAGLAASHARLAEVDPDCAARIHPHDRKRIGRALEVHAATGRPLSVWQRENTRPPIEGEVRIAGLRWPDVLLRARIEERVDRMLASGLVEEVRELEHAGRLGRTARESIGYREVLELLAGRLDLAQCRLEIARNTWRLSRRQQNWFRQFPEIRWIDAERDPRTKLEAAREALSIPG